MVATGRTGRQTRDNRLPSSAAPPQPPRQRTLTDESTRGSQRRSETVEDLSETDEYSELSPGGLAGNREPAEGVWYRRWRHRSTADGLLRRALRADVADAARRGGSDYSGWYRGRSGWWALRQECRRVCGPGGVTDGLRGTTGTCRRLRRRHSRAVSLTGDSGTGDSRLTAVCGRPAVTLCGVPLPSRAAAARGVATSRRRRRDDNSALTRPGWLHRAEVCHWSGKIPATGHIVRRKTDADFNFKIEQKFSRPRFEAK